MVKFYLHPESYGYDKNMSMEEIFVSDYYSGHQLSAQDAYFVQGSDVLGPMGNELIPFKDPDQAQVFFSDHHGEKMLRWNQINDAVIASID